MNDQILTTRNRSGWILKLELKMIEKGEAKKIRGERKRERRAMADGKERGDSY